MRRAEIVLGGMLLLTLAVGCAREGTGGSASDVGDNGTAAAAEATPAPGDEWAEERRRMVETQIRAKGIWDFRAPIRDERVIHAMLEVPRHEFVPESVRHLAYADTALPIGEDQTISQPYIVAFMTEQLRPKPTDRVLEIGTGSGYQAAVLAELVKKVYTIEIVEALGRRAAETLKKLRYDNVVTRIGDGYRGWREHAPFDAVIVTCAPTEIPQPLKDQLKEGGRMIIPVGRRGAQDLYLLEKRKGKITQTAVLAVAFVPMTGEAEGKGKAP